MMRSSRLTCYFALTTIPFINAFVQKRDTTVLTDAAGQVHSPNYPEDYPPNVDFQWIIAAPRGKKFRFQLNEFVLERFHDLLQFYNGSNTERKRAPFIEITGRCTKANPDECLSENMIVDRNIVSIRFQSDYSNQYKGFNLSYSIF